MSYRADPGDARPVLARRIDADRRCGGDGAPVAVAHQEQTGRGSPRPPSNGAGGAVARSRVTAAAPAASRRPARQYVGAAVTRIRHQPAVDAVAGRGIGGLDQSQRGQVVAPRGLGEPALAQAGHEVPLDQRDAFLDVVPGPFGPGQQRGRDVADLPVAAAVDDQPIARIQPQRALGRRRSRSGSGERFRPRRSHRNSRRPRSPRLRDPSGSSPHPLRGSRG